MHTGDSTGIDATQVKVDLVATVLMEMGEVEHVGGVWIGVNVFS